MDSILTRTGEEAPVIDKGHGTKALGPSDSSDSGSDVQGGPGLAQELSGGGDLNLDRGSTSDMDLQGTEGSAGADIGDANLDSDSDAEGTGERATAGRDLLRENGDIGPDRIEDIGGVVLGSEDTDAGSDFEDFGDEENAEVTEKVNDESTTGGNRRSPRRS